MATPLPKIKKIHRFFMYLLNLLVLDNNVLKSIGKQKIKPILALTLLSVHINFYETVCIIARKMNQWGFVISQTKLSSTKPHRKSPTNVIHRIGIFTALNSYQRRTYSHFHSSPNLNLWVWFFRITFYIIQIHRIHYSKIRKKGNLGSYIVFLIG